ncbi:MAG: TetR family transcriptional regulator [Pseudonocardiales bacterium]|nr:TetR family transcriptional regulator [Pseudonocardiales bacterium]
MPTSKGNSAAARPKESAPPTSATAKSTAAKSTAAETTAKSAAKARTRATTKPKPLPKPRGREQITESVIEATLSLWTTEGPAKLSLRSIAARAGVNYGLVHRHFGTKEAVIRAAMHHVVTRSLGYIEDSSDLIEAIDSVLPRSTGSHSRLVAWSILQFVIDDVMPTEDAFLTRMRDLAAADVPRNSADADLEASFRAGTILALLYGWRLFEPYLVRGLGLDSLSHAELNERIRASMLRVLSVAE